LSNGSIRLKANVFPNALTLGNGSLMESAKHAMTHGSMSLLRTNALAVAKIINNGVIVKMHAWTVVISGSLL